MGKAPKSPGPDEHGYWNKIQRAAVERGSDGCTAVPDIHVECCWQHDIEWSGRMVDGTPISRADANRRFRECIQSRSKLGRFSPMSWWRFGGVWIGTVWERMTK